ncbi:hypothetical protein B1R32_107174 [Abditibacterium utsteinense]|uniref:Uncharacterized protein n=1 Tax=Abditibacterium utsteinense TaxID=1960156 RepID=A0A2S8STP2_9BACT|nr:hypothetical protein [Abditibacterium utsteinense]PQV64148.1 hypothetical protein B1R32_107174 [Abditibacterium utsteinense]
MNFPSRPVSHPETEMPKTAQRAFESYPQIAAPRDFNRRVLLALEARQSARKTTFLGRIEEFLGLPIGQFLGSGALGAFFPALVLSVICLSGRGDVSQAPQKPSAIYLRFYGPFFPRELFGLRGDVA